MDSLREGGKRRQVLSRLAVFTTPPAALRVRTAGSFVLLIGCATAGCAPPESECEEMGWPSSRLASSGSLSVGTGGERRLPRIGFNMLPVKDDCPPVPARRTDESKVYLWRMISNECREKRRGAARCYNFA